VTAVRGFLRAAQIAIVGLAIFCAHANGQTEIVQYRAKLFSVLAPASCQRTDQVNFELALNCEFRGLNVRFYLKEDLPIVIREHVTDNWASVTEIALDTFAKAHGTPHIVDRIRFGSSTASIGPDRSILTKSGFLYRTVDDAQQRRWGNYEKRVLLRLHYIEGWGSSVLVAFSDLVIIGDDMRREVVFPEEAKAMLVSLDRINELTVPR
jgi:hypothetical protein